MNPPKVVHEHPDSLVTMTTEMRCVVCSARWKLVGGIWKVA